MSEHKHIFILLEIYNFENLGGQTSLSHPYPRIMLNTRNGKVIKFQTNLLLEMNKLMEMK